MSLPTILLFERHWDPSAKQVLKELLARAEYETLCLEAPSKDTEKKILTDIQKALENDKETEQQVITFLETSNAKLHLLKHDLNISTPWHHWPFEDLYALFSSSYRADISKEIAHALKNLEANKLLSEILKNYCAPPKASVSIVGVDIGSALYNKMKHCDTIKEQESLILPYQNIRNEKVFENLMNARATHKGIIFICDVFHAKYFIEQIAARRLESEFVVRFPHSEHRFFKTLSLDSELNKISQEINPFRVFCNEQTMPSIMLEIFEEIAIKNTKYLEDTMAPTATSEALARIFESACFPKVRAGMYVDGCFERTLTQNERLKIPEVSVTDRILNDKKISIIANINTTPVATAILSASKLFDKKKTEARPTPVKKEGIISSTSNHGKTVLLFERHWDIAPKQVLQALLESGDYTTLCVEAPHDAQASEIIYSIQTNLVPHKRLARLIIRAFPGQSWSELDTSEIAEKLPHIGDRMNTAHMLKGLRATELLADIFVAHTGKKSTALIGIDLSESELGALRRKQTTPISEMHLRVNMARVIDKKFFEKLIKARAAHPGVVLLCGSMHAPYMIEQIRCLGLEDQFIIRFVHSAQRLDKTLTLEAEIAYCAPAPLSDYILCCDGTKESISSALSSITDEIALKSQKSGVHFQAPRADRLQSTEGALSAGPDDIPGLCITHPPKVKK